MDSCGSLIYTTPQSPDASDRRPLRGDRVRGASICQMHAVLAEFNRMRPLSRRRNPSPLLIRWPFGAAEIQLNRSKSGDYGRICAENVFAQ
jgi:hypothetical protein